MPPTKGCEDDAARRGGKRGCEEDGVGRAVREGSLEAVI